ncbi:hypothetical protein D7Y22_15350 [Stenotrophomonas maltophilia]|nr:hypothetical protein [Stenotrophomonas maltophilia]
MDFKADDQVQLDGGPAMRIAEITDGKARCYWVDKAGTPREATYPLTVLRKYSPSFAIYTV